MCDDVIRNDARRSVNACDSRAVVAGLVNHLFFAEPFGLKRGVVNDGVVRDDRRGMIAKDAGAALAHLAVADDEAVDAGVVRAGDNPPLIFTVEDAAVGVDVALPGLGIEAAEKVHVRLHFDRLTLVLSRSDKHCVTALFAGIGDLR